MRFVFAALILMLLPAAVIAAERIPGNMLILQGLDKVTARISTLNVKVGETVAFGTLQITLRACEKTPPEDPPETTAFLDILEQRDEEEAVSLFRGWMFASTPALSALEHPVYDVWVLECVTEPTEAAE